MKLTIEIPDEAVLVTFSIVTQNPTELHNVNLGVFPIAHDDLKDGNVLDFKTSYDELHNRENAATP